jgi:hypothetical protein
MKVSSIMSYALILCCAFFLTVLPSSATTIKTVRSGSGYGPLDTTAPNPYSDCLSLGEPCIGYINDSFTINGTSYLGQLYSFTDGVGNVGNFDLVDLGNVTSFTLPMKDISLESGVFACGTPSGTGVDSTGVVALVGLDCTQGTSSSLMPLFTVSSKGNSETFNFSSPENWVVYTVDGNLDTSSTVSTPEPSVLLLLVVGGIGILLAALKR